MVLAPTCKFILSIVGTSMFEFTADIQDVGFETRGDLKDWWRQWSPASHVFVEINCAWKMEPCCDCRDIFLEFYWDISLFSTYIICFAKKIIFEINLTVMLITYRNFFDIHFFGFQAVVSSIIFVILTNRFLILFWGLF